jgi:hypothetical protein
MKNNLFDKSLKKKLRKVKALNLPYLTTLMEETVILILRLLNKKNNGREFLEAQLDYCNKESWTKLTDRQKAEMDEMALHHLLRAQDTRTQMPLQR